MMRIQEIRFIRGSCCLKVLFVVLLVMVTVMCAANKFQEQEEPLLAYLFDSKEISQNMIELFQTKCMHEFLHAKKTLRDVELKERSDGNEEYFSRTKMQEALTVLCPHVKKSLLDCLRQENPSESWYSRWSKKFPFSSTRRELGQKSKEEAPPFPTTAIFAALAVLAIAVLAFLCLRSSTGVDVNDESPLLNLTGNGNSTASALKVNSFGAEEKFDNLSFNSRLSQAQSSLSLYPDPHILTNSKHEIPLPPPPGITPLKLPPGRMSLDPPSSNALGPTPPLDPEPPPMRPPLPPMPPGAGTGPRPPPPPPRGGAPPPPVRGGPRTVTPGIRPPCAPPGPHDCEGASKAKLKPFFWDKVTANSDDSMVWNQIRAGSFQFNEEMIESLFGCAPSTKHKNETNRDTSNDNSPQFIQIIDARKSQNLSILLRALNVTTEEIHAAPTEGNELPPELVQTLIKMAPTAEEELKLGLYNGDITKLGPADRFLKVMVEVPLAFKRLESLLFMCTFEDESTTLKEAFVILQAACAELRKNRLFLKLLEAVLKTGNRMNDGTFRGGVQAFKLDTLLKLSDVKGLDGKTTLLHFVVQEIIRSEGLRAARAAREMRSMSSFKSEELAAYDTSTCESDEDLRSIGLEVVSGLADDLESVRKAAVLDVDGLTGSVSRLGQALFKCCELLDTDMSGGEEDGFCVALRSFVEDVEKEIKGLLDEEKRIMVLMKSTADYFHGNAGKEEGLRLFVIVRDFLVILDKVCKEVKSSTKQMDVVVKKSAVLPPKNPAKVNFQHQILTDKRMDSSSSSSDD